MRGSSGGELDHAALVLPRVEALSCSAHSRELCFCVSDLIILCNRDLAHVDYALTSAYERLFPLVPTSPFNYLDGGCISIIALTLGAKCHRSHQEPGFFIFSFSPIAKRINTQPHIPLRNHNT